MAEPHLWAEDGMVFLQGALTDGWLSIFRQFGGYLQILQRMVIHLLALFPLSWLPTLVAVACFVLYAAFAAQFARPAFRVYVPSDGARVLTSGLMCFLPGIGEVAGNLANLFRPVFLFAWFLALKPPRLAFRTWELAALTLFAFSAGQVVVIVPMLALRLYAQVRDRRPRAVVGREVAAILIVVLGAAVNTLQPRHPASLPPPHPGDVVSAAASLLPRVLVYQPWLGPDRTIQLSASVDALASIAGFLVLAVIVGIFLKRRGFEGRQMVLGLAAAYAVWPITMSVRPEAMGVIEQAPEFFWSMRYGYQMAPFAVVLWVTLFSPRHLYRKGMLQLSAVFAIVYLLSNEGYSSIRAYGTELDWQADVVELEMAINTGCPPEVFVPVYPLLPTHPNHWGVRYQGDTGHCLATLSGARAAQQQASDTAEPDVLLDVEAPAPGSSVESSFVIAGWALDRRAENDTGVEDVQVWALPTSTGAPVFLGQATLDGERPEIGEAYGARFVSAGYTLSAEGLPSGSYELLVAAFSGVTDSFESVRSVPIVVTGPE